MPTPNGIDDKSLNEKNSEDTLSNGVIKTPTKLLSLWDAISLIFGIIIGASIYQAPPEIFRNVPSPETGMLAWIVGGIVCLLGALTYAELASTFRNSGGDYYYLSRAYGSSIGFIFAWSELSVIRTGGSIAFMAYVFAGYADHFYSLGNNSKLIYASSSIVLLTLINSQGFRMGRLLQNLLTSANIIGLCILILIGFFCYFFGQSPLTDSERIAVEISSVTAEFASPTLHASQIASKAFSLPEILSPSLALAMVLVFYAYGGWNEAAFIAGEVKNPERNITRSLVLGTLLVGVLYTLVNLAYLSALGYSGTVKSKAIAADVFAIPFGESGRKGISILVMSSALGSINGLLFTGMRLYGTFGKDHRLFSWLSGKDGTQQRNLGALYAQAIFSLFLILVVELAAEWRSLLVYLAKNFAITLSDDFHKHGGIYRLVTCTAPIFWLFFLLTGLSLFVLRYREPEIERSFRVPLYPWIPGIFCFSCAFMLYRSSMYAIDEEPAEAIIVGLLIFMAFPLWFLSGKEKEE